MARLPVVGDDENAWGGILNEFLLVAHNEDGTLKNGSSSSGIGVYSAVVYIDDTSVIAKDYKGDTIASGTAGTDDASVIQSALDNLTSERTWYEKVVLFGSFIANQKISIPNWTIVELIGAIKLADDVNDFLFTNKDTTSPSHITIKGGYYDGNKANQSSPADALLYFDGVNDLVLSDLFIENPCNRGIELVGWGQRTILNNMSIINPTLHGIGMGTVQQVRANNIYIYGAGEYAIVASCVRSVFTNIISRKCARGFELAYDAEDIILSGYVSYEDDWGVTIRKGTKIVLSNIIVIDPTNEVGIWAPNWSESINEPRTDITINNFLLDGGYINWYADASENISIKNGLIVDSPRHGVVITYQNDAGNGKFLIDNIVIKNINVDNDGYAYGIRSNVPYTTIRNCRILAPANQLYYGIRIYDQATNSVIKNNDVRLAGNPTIALIEALSDSVVEENLGYPTENDGTATIPIHYHYVVVDHGLPHPPCEIQVTGKHDEVSDIYVDNITSTQFRIRISGDVDVTDNREVYWKAKCQR